MMKKIARLLTCLVFAAWGGVASADLADAISGLAPGSSYRVMFASGIDLPRVRLATSTSIISYNDWVTSVAGAGTVTGPLGLGWKALVSTSAVNAQINTGTDRTSTEEIHIFNTNGDLLATSYSDLWDGVLLNPVGYDIDGVQLTLTTVSLARVWTGTDPTGLTTDESGQGPLGSQFVSSFGSALQSDERWLRSDFDMGAGPGLALSGGNEFAIYGISDVVQTEGGARRGLPAWLPAVIADQPE
jgi:hypothetical protein